MTGWDGPEAPSDVTGDRSRDDARLIADDQLSTSEVKTRAAAGTILLVGRSAAIRFIGLASNIVLARLLVPSDFGIVALGLTLVSFGGFVSDAGLGMGLVRRDRAPTRAELEAIVAWQLVAAALIAVLAIAVTAVIGGSSRVTGLMMLSLPILALRTPGLLYLERQLDYRVRVWVELIETLTYFVWACSTALIGWGAWSMASGAVMKSVVGVAAVAMLTPLGFIRPRFGIEVIRPLLGFGLRFQGLGVLHRLHDLGLIAGISAVGGLSSLGMWALTGRILQVPFMLYEALWSISMPAYSRLLHAGENVGALLERSVTVLAVSGGLALTVLAGCGAALIHVVFGSKWDDAALILPGACLALAFSGPINICMMGALYAAGDAQTPLRAALVHAAVRLPLSVLGLHYLGIGALGWAWAIAQASELPMVLPRVTAVGGAPLGRKVVWPTVAAVVGGALGMALVSVVGTGFAGVLVGAFASACAFIATLACFDRGSLTVTLETLRRVLRITLDRRRGVEGTQITEAV